MSATQKDRVLPSANTFVATSSSPAAQKLFENISNQQSMITKNPAPDATPPGAPSTYGTFVVSR